MGKQVVHFVYVRKGFTEDSIITGSACGRETMQDAGGINSDDKIEAVTCKLCLKHPRYLNAKGIANFVKSAKR